LYEVAEEEFQPGASFVEGVYRVSLVADFKIDHSIFVVDAEAELFILAPKVSEIKSISNPLVPFADYSFNVASVAASQIVQMFQGLERNSEYVLEE
jgi:hypothetical protein